MTAIRQWIDLFESASRDEPWMDHGDEAADYEMWEPKHGIDDFVRTEFTCGRCAYLALVLNEIGLGRIWAEIDEYGDLGHVWIVNQQGRAVDINGVHPNRVAKTKYNDPRWLAKQGAEPTPRGEVQDITSKIDTLLDGVDTDAMDWARQIVANHPKHFGIDPNADRNFRGWR